MTEEEPVTLIAARYVDDIVAQEVAAALNGWFKWILAGTEMPAPLLFEPLGVDTADYAFSLQEAVDWQVGPHARVVDVEVRVSLETRDTHILLAGLMKRLGALAVRVSRDSD